MHRRDFPVLLHNPSVVYLDSACTTLQPKQVISAVTEYSEHYSGCEGRSSHAFSRYVSEVVASTRDTLHSFFSVKQGEFVFTRNATEALNWVIHSCSKKEIVVVSDREHNSCFVPVLRSGASVRIVRSNPDHTFDLERFALACHGASLVCIVMKSNLDGYVLPIKKIVQIAHEQGCRVLVDGCQAAGHMPVSLKNMDYFACSSHKMCGPTGLGTLYARDLDSLQAPFAGGGTVDDVTYKTFVPARGVARFEAGIQHYAGIAGFGAALRYLSHIGLDEIRDHEKMMSCLAAKQLDDISRVGVPVTTGIFSFNLPMSCHDVAVFLEEYNKVYVRSGRLCMHPWFNSHHLEGCVRASFGLYTEKRDVLALAAGVRTAQQVFLCNSF